MCFQRERLDTLEAKGARLQIERDDVHRCVLGDQQIRPRNPTVTFLGPLSTRTIRLVLLIMRLRRVKVHAKFECGKLDVYRSISDRFADPCF